MALVSIADGAAIIGCARNSLYRKIRTGELKAVDGPNGLCVEADGLRDRWLRITRTRTDSPKWMGSKANPAEQAAAEEAVALRQRIENHPAVGSDEFNRVWDSITETVNGALKAEDLELRLTTRELQEIWFAVEDLVFEQLPLEHARSPEFVAEFGWVL
jgi:hypothetical protein